MDSFDISPEYESSNPKKGSPGLDGGFRFLSIPFQTLGGQIALLTSLCLLVVTGLFTWHLTEKNTASALNSLHHQIEGVAKNIGSVGAQYILAGDNSIIENILLQAGHLPDIERIEITNPNGRVLSTAVRHSDGSMKALDGLRTLSVPKQLSFKILEKGGKLIAWNPIVADGVIGWVRATVSLDRIETIRGNIWKTNFLLNFLVFLIAVTVIVLFLRYRMRELHLASDFAARLGENEGELLDVRWGTRETRRLGRALNEASRRLFIQETEILAKSSSLKEAQRIAHIGSWEWNITDGGLSWSEETYCIFGIEAGKFKATYGDFLDRVHPSDLGALRRAVNASMKTGDPYRVEFRIVRPDGAIRHIEEQGEISTGGNGAPQRMSGTVQDITERREALKAAERMGRIVESSLNEVYVFDAETFKFVEVNQGARENLGYSMQEMRSLAAIDLTPEIAPSEFDKMIEPLRSGERKVIKFETVHRRKDGSEYPVEVHLQSALSETPPVFVAIILDITERKRAEEDRRVALIKAEEANQAKSEFLATMSHELRTPLNAVLGFSEVLSEQYFGPLGGDKYIEYAHNIHDSGRHLLELVNDILDISTIEAGKYELNREALNIKEIVEESCLLVAPKAKAGGIDLIQDFPDDSATLYADRRALKQILLNLLSNAVKFTPAGGEVRLSTAAANGKVSIRIADTGIGILTEKLPHLTDPFVRAEPDPYKSQEGAGLGLAITKSLVDLHEGSLLIESAFGKGTTVTLNLPSAQP